MNYQRVTITGLEPVTLEEAKNHLRIDHSDDDASIMAIITAAREMCEAMTNRAIIKSNWIVTLDNFPDEIRINRCPVSAITRIRYIDQGGNLQTITVEGYQFSLISEPARIVPTSEWPFTSPKAIDAVQVEFSAGWEKDEVPHSIVSAMLLIIGHLYENREEVVVGRTANQLPRASEWLLNPYRIFEF